MTGRRLYHAHNIVAGYAGSRPAGMLYGVKEGVRETLPNPYPLPKDIMSRVAKFPVFYWSEDSLVAGTAWYGKAEKDEVGKRFKNILWSDGAVHFFDEPQIVHHPEAGQVPCIGMIRYGRDMVALLYPDDYGEWNWDDLDRHATYNLYLMLGSTFTEFIHTWTLMLEAYANTPVEASVRSERRPTRPKGVSEATRRSYARNPIQVVILRKLKSKEAKETIRTIGSGRAIEHQFEVRGHPRNQWYASEGVHRTIWIEPYTKGKGLPPKESTPVVHKVVERRG